MKMKMKMKMCVVFVILLHVSQHASAVEVKVEVYKGVESVVLPCHLSETTSNDSAVAWNNKELNPSLVHFRDQNSDKLTNQNKLYCGRTSMKTDSMKTGDLSLTLKYPIINDSGIYTCIVRRKGDELNSTTVQLSVTERPSAERILVGVMILLFIMMAVVYYFSYFHHKEAKDRIVPGVKVESGVESVQLPCKITGLLPVHFRVEWRDSRNWKMYVYEDGSDQPNQQNSFYKGRTEIKRRLLKAGDFSLTLKHPTDRDRGTYTCILYNKEGKVLMKEKVELLVKDPQVEVDSGVESVQLPFKTSDRLPKHFRVQWMNEYMDKVHTYENGSDSNDDQCVLFRGRTEMKKVKDGDVSLTLKYPTTEDSGIFICTVYDEQDLILLRRDLELLVNDPQVKLVHSGVESVKLSCKTKGPPPDHFRVQWMNKYENKVHTYENGSDKDQHQCVLFRGRTELMKKVKNGDVSLTLKYPTTDDSGIFTCTVYDEQDLILLKKEIKLQVNDAQVVSVDSGVESVVLPCVTTVHLAEDVRVEWRNSKINTGLDRTINMVHVYENSDQPKKQSQFYRGRTEMKRDPEKPGDFNLTLKYPTDRDSDIYTCIIYNRQRNILMKKDVNLRVKVKHVLEVESREESVQLPCVTTVHLPKNVRVEWKTRSNKIVHVYEDGSDRSVQDEFYKDRTEMKKDLKHGNFSLTLKNPTDTDSDIYTCIIYNRERNILMKKDVKLGVKVDPVVVKVGVESVQLPFRTTGDLPEDTTVVWRCGQMMVHVYQNGSDQPEEQNQVYKVRTEMKKDLLKTGDLSLTLNHPTGRDRGKYVCEVFHHGVIMRQKTVWLIVRGASTLPTPDKMKNERAAANESTPLNSDSAV